MIEEDQHFLILKIQMFRQWTFWETGKKRAINPISDRTCRFHPFRTKKNAHTYKIRLVTLLRHQLLCAHSSRINSWNDSIWLRYSDSLQSCWNYYEQTWIIWTVPFMSAQIQSAKARAIASFYTIFHVFFLLKFILNLMMAICVMISVICSTINMNEIYVELFSAILTRLQ